MLNAIRKIRSLLDPRDKIRAFILLCLMLITGIVEAIGVASIMPFVAVLAEPQVVTQNAYLFAVYRAFGFQSTTDFLFFVGFAVFAVVVGSAALKALTAWMILRFSYYRNHALSCRLLQGYLNQPYVWFARRHSSDLAKSLLAEVNEVIKETLIPVLQALANGVTVVMIFGLLLVVDPALALSTAMVFGGIYLALYWSTSRYIARTGKRRLAANRGRFRVTHDVFSGLKDVKIRGLERTFLHQFRVQSQAFARAHVAGQIVGQLPQYALHAVAFGGILLIVQYQMFIKGDLGSILPVVALYAFAGYRLLPALQLLYQLSSRIRFGAASLNLLHDDLAELNTEPAPESDSARPLRLNKALELRSVGFTYPASKAPALEAIDLVVPARTTIALVGTTGSGKTTIADIISGLLEPDQGQLLVDGAALNQQNRRSWMRSIGYVPQHVFLLDGTLAENIAFGADPKAVSMQDVERAATIARLHSFVMDDLPNGYETTLGERGVRLSGGQRQRVAIARALYHDPDVLIFDEATSALDNLTERAVMDAVDDLGHRKTIILIAHRLTTVRRCDEIFVIDKGRVAASGTYNELVNRNEGFRAMVESGYTNP